MELISAKIARKINIDYLDQDVSRMPSVREIAAKYSVSRATANKALRILAETGIIEVGARRRAIVPGAEKKREQTKTDRELWLREKIKSEIDSGKIQVGRRLSKQLYWSVEYGLSLRAVSRVFNSLVEQDYAHYRGRNIYAGPVAGRKAVKLTAPPSTILILCRRHQIWSGLWSASRTEQFCRTFIDESERFGVQCKLVLADSDQRWPHYYDVRLDSFVRTMENIGDRFLGALIAAGREDFPVLAPWLRRLESHHARVVWFDRNDEGWPRDIPLGKFVRCFCSQKATIRSALDFLKQAGHRMAAFVIPRDADWIDERIKLLQQIGSQTKPHMSITPVRIFSSDMWNTPITSGMLSLFDHSLHSSFPKAARAYRECVKMAPDHRKLLQKFSPAESVDAETDSIVCIIRAFTHNAIDPDLDLWHLARALCSAFVLFQIRHEAPDATVIISPNDAMAMTYHLAWLQDLEIDLPGDISLLSFDNKIRDSQFPLSSIDFGMGNLGYQAFHMILGDLPEHLCRRKEVFAQPSVIDRGSVKVLTVSA